MGGGKPLAVGIIEDLGGMTLLGDAFGVFVTDEVESGLFATVDEIVEVEVFECNVVRLGTGGNDEFIVG